MRTVAMTDAEPTDVIQRATEAAREMLGMDLAYVADTRAGMQDYTATAGGDSFGISTDVSIPLAGTYCELMLRGDLENIVRDAQNDPRVARLDLTSTASIGSYIGTPVVLPDGRVYGTFCALSHEPSHHLRERDVKFMRVLGRLIGDQIHREERERGDDVTGRVTALLAALEARDGYTEAHSHSVVTLALDVGRLLGVNAAGMRDLEHAALLHDIGKLGVSDAVLRKPAPLDHDEWREVKRHPEIGERIVASMPPLAHLAPVIRAEHERWDGAGYPDGLAGTDIPLASRIVLACDAFDAMTTDRPYRGAISIDAARRELAANGGSQFDPGVVAALLVVLPDPGADHSSAG